MHDIWGEFTPQPFSQHTLSCLLGEQWDGWSPLHAFSTFQNRVP